MYLIRDLNLSLDTVAISLTFWSLAAASVFALVAFFGRIALKAYHSSRQDRGIVMSLYDDAARSAKRYERGLQQLIQLGNQWKADPSFVPFSRLTKSKYQPLDSYRERLSILLPLPIYSRVVEFYEVDDHFDAAYAAIFDASFAALPVDRRLLWLHYMNESGQEQKDRAAAVCKAIENRFGYIARAAKSAHPCPDKGGAASN